MDNGLITGSFACLMDHTNVMYDKPVDAVILWGNSDVENVKQKFYVDYLRDI